MRLGRDKINQIIVAVHQGEMRSAISKRFDVDRATIDYHVEQFEERYGSTAAIYSIIPVQKKACCHPSLKCLVCGKAQDNLRREELEKITKLERALNAANTRLESYGHTPIELGTV